MTPASFIDTIVRRRYIIIGVLLAALLASPLIAKGLRSSYIGTASLLLVNEDPGRTLVPISDLPVLVTSPVVLQRVREKLNLATPVDVMAGRVDTKAGLKTNVLPVTYRDANPRLAVAVPNAIADETVIFYKELAGAQFRQVESYLSRSAAAKQAEIRDLDRRLQEAAGENPQVTVDDALGKLSAQFSDLLAQQAVARAAMVADQAAVHEAGAQSKDIASIVRTETLASDSYVQTLRNGTSKDAAQLAFDKAQYSSRYPGLASLQAQVQKEQRSVQQAETSAVQRGPSSQTYVATVLDQHKAQAQLAGDQAKLAALTDQVNASRRTIRTLSTNGVSADALRIQLASAQADYTALQTRLGTTKADQAEASSLAALVVIDRATTAGTKLPTIVRVFLAAFAILIVAFGAAFLYDALDTGLRVPAEIERLYGRPLLGTLGTR